MEVKEISDRLKLARDIFELRQSEFASKCGIAYSTYQKYEMELSKPSSDALAGFVKAGINANWILTGEGEMLLNAPSRIEAQGNPVFTSTKNEDESNKVDQKYVADLQKCLAACQRLYGDDFNNMDAIIQHLFAKDLHENLQKYFRTFWPFYNSLNNCSLDLMGDDGVYYELQNLKKLSAVMKFPYNPNEDMFKI